MTTFRPRLLWPLLLIGLGAILLLQALSLLPASLWWALAQLWPALLVLAGLELLIGRRSARGAAAAVGLSALLVVAALTWAALRASQLPPGGSETLIQTIQGAARLSTRIDFQSGRLTVSALGPSDHLLEGSAQDGPGEAVAQSYAVRGAEGQLRLQQHIDPLLAPFLARRIPTAEWNVLLTRKLPLALEVNTGDGSAALDFNDLQLSTLDLSSGPGQTSITFAPGQAAAHLHTGMGATLINLPAGFPVRLRVRAGLTRVSLPASLSPAGDTFTTAGFNPAQPFLDLEISAGLGPVSIN